MGLRWVLLPSVVCQWWALRYCLPTGFWGVRQRRRLGFPRLPPSPWGVRQSWGILLFLLRGVPWLRAARLRHVVLGGVWFHHEIRTCPLLFLLRGVPWIRAACLRHVILWEVWFPHATHMCPHLFLAIRHLGGFMKVFSDGASCASPGLTLPSGSRGGGLSLPSLLSGLLPLFGLFWGALVRFFVRRISRWALVFSFGWWVSWRARFLVLLGQPWGSLIVRSSPVVPRTSWF